MEIVLLLVFLFVVVAPLLWWGLVIWLAVRAVQSLNNRLGNVQSLIQQAGAMSPSERLALSSLIQSNWSTALRQFNDLDRSRQELSNARIDAIRSQAASVGITLPD